MTFPKGDPRTTHPPGAKEAQRRRALFLQGRPPSEVRDKIAIIVDDGLATGLAMLAAIHEIRKRESWLPIIFHTEPGPWQFTVMYSNTGLAHRLGRTHDWVVIFFSRDHSEDGQSTVVTESRGQLCGRRVVRGREGECEAYYHTPLQLTLGVA